MKLVCAAVFTGLVEKRLIIVLSIFLNSMEGHSKGSQGLLGERKSVVFVIFRDTVVLIFHVNRGLKVEDL